MAEEIEVPEEEFKADCIDDALMSLIDSLGEDDEDPDSPYEELMDTIADMIDAEEIGEIPDAGDHEDLKLEWVNTAIPLIKTKLEIID